MNRTNIYLPTPMLDALRQLAKTKDISVAEVIRQAVELYLKGQGK